MNATTVAVDLAKSVFELAAADEHWKVVGRARLTYVKRNKTDAADALALLEAARGAVPGDGYSMALIDRRA